MLCPNCKQGLVPDQNNPNTSFCHSCNIYFDTGSVQNYWNAQPQPQGPILNKTIYEPQENDTVNQTPVYEQQPQQLQEQVYYQNPQTQPSFEFNQAPVAPVSVNPYTTQHDIYYSQRQASKGLAIASLVMGIIALLGAWLPLLNIVSIALGIASVICGMIAIGELPTAYGTTCR